MLSLISGQGGRSVTISGSSIERNVYESIERDSFKSIGKRIGRYHDKRPSHRLDNEALHRHDKWTLQGLNYFLHKLPGVRENPTPTTPILVGLPLRPCPRLAQGGPNKRMSDFLE
jgi:hypothetical protein